MPKEITWADVQSSMLRRIAYHAPSMTLYAEFPNGSIYVYYDVQPEDVVEVLFAEHAENESVGKAFTKHIKRRGYSYTRLTEEEAEQLRALLGGGAEEEAEEEEGEENGRAG